MDSISGTLLSQVGFSTPAKFILSGEHSVVYGKDAIVATVDLRTFGWCSLKFIKNGTKAALSVELHDIGKNIQLVRVC